MMSPLLLRKKRPGTVIHPCTSLCLTHTSLESRTHAGWHTHTHMHTGTQAHTHAHTRWNHATLALVLTV